MKIMLTLLYFLLSSILLAQSISIDAHVTDGDTDEPIIFCSAQLYKNGTRIASAASDYNGYFIFSTLDEGFYQLKISYTGYHPKQISVNACGQSVSLNIKLEDDDGLICLDHVFPPMVYPDLFETGRHFIKDDVYRTAVRF